MGTFRKHLNSSKTATRITTRKQASSLLLISQQSSTMLSLKSTKNLPLEMAVLAWVWLQCQSMAKQLGNILMGHYLPTPCTLFLQDFIMDRVSFTFLISFYLWKLDGKTTLKNSKGLQVCCCVIWEVTDYKVSSIKIV